MKKMKLSKKLILAALSVLMVATTAVSFALWSTGINTNTDDANGDFTVEIGGAGVIEAELNIGAFTAGGDKELVPSTLEAIDEATETQEITATGTVTWTASATQDDTVNPDDMALFTNKLTVTLQSAKDEFEIDVSEYFTVAVVGADEDGIDITADAPVTVTLKVTMTKEPVDYVAYKAIAGANVTFTLKFSVDNIEYETDYGDYVSSNEGV